MNTFPIGIFDSGVGGTSVWRAINTILPAEATLYLADSSNAPYGEKSRDEIITLSVKNTDLLLKHGCKLIVVACNTATTNAINYLRNCYSVPFIGIEPAIKPAAVQTKTKAVGILATQRTLNSELFHKTATLHGRGVRIITQAGEGLVALIEAGKTACAETRRLLRTYLIPMLDMNIDCLVLGCTHYSYLIPEIRKILPRSVTIIDPGTAVARQTRTVLEKHHLLNTTGSRVKHQFFSNLNAPLLAGFLPDVTNAEIHVDYRRF